MKRFKSLDYTFAIGKIRALENFLIKDEVFEEAIESDMLGALRLFAETDLYSDELLHIKDSQELERVLGQELLKLKKLVAGLILDKELLGLLDLDTLKCTEHIFQDYANEFLKDYLMHLVDMHNIRTYLRLYLLKEPQEKLAANLTCEGFIKRKDFLELYHQDLAAFLNRLEYVHKHCACVDYTYDLGEAIEKTVEENSFIYLEKAMNDLLMRFLKPAKYLVFGPEPVLAYYFAKVNEINLIRMIILAKLNGLPGELVQKRLNLAYA